MQQGVVVTGMGVVTCLGFGVEENLLALKSGRHGIAPPELLRTFHHEMPLGEVRSDRGELISRSGPTHPPFWSRTALIALIAAREALLMARITPNHLTGLMNGTTVGGMDRTEDFYPGFMENERHGHMREVFNHDCGGTSEQLAEELGVRGFLASINTACSSSVNTIMLAARMIRAGRIKNAIAGGADGLSRFTLNGFNSLMILDKELCRPFDQSRKGLNLGEGAAYVVLETEEDALKSGKRILARVSGYANTNDAHHQTASSPDGTGARMAMEEALKEGGLRPADIDHINAHGTATPNNDETEAAAIRTVFASSPPVTSTKSFTGHTLGAAGAVESVFSILSIGEQMMFPTLRLENPLSEHPLTYVTSPENRTVNHVLSNSFGFGGNCSSIIFSRP